MADLGIIDISDLNVPPEKHELTTARLFAEQGYNIKFIRPSNRKGNHTPDFWMNRLSWEVKSPRGKKLRCIADNIRDATKQANNLIIDLRRIKIPDQRCISKIRYEIKDKHNFKRILAITHDGKILTIK